MSLAYTFSLHFKALSEEISKYYLESFALSVYFVYLVAACPTM